ncbi:hypothetical protein QJS04_geneDACA020791 [Acorus gramineus]|uniref:Agouti signaling protein n=1 Tax=Acorus gramineus TaxID=55184 RepID=A0AAV9A4C8_ACOGR|nr:hypothetical protein QJS04_geneDACA020791 [Acorus gramineus]
MLILFNLVITPTMASRGIPTNAKPVEKESELAEHKSSDTSPFRALKPPIALKPVPCFVNCQSGQPAHP